MKVLTDEELDNAIAARPFEKVTKEYIESRILRTDFSRMNATVTLCNIVLDNGYSVRGESACVDPRNYDETIGQNLAYRQAFNKLWPLFGFLLAEKLLLKDMKEKQTGEPTELKL